MIPSTDRMARDGLVRRIALGAVAVIGAFLVIFPLAIGLPGKSAASGDMMTAFRPQMTDTALAAGSADIATVGAMSKQMQTQMLPDLAAQMHLSQQQMGQFFATSFPAVSTGMQQLPQVMARFGGLHQIMVDQQGNYQQADQIPTPFLPPTTMTLLFVLPGGVLLLIAAFGFYRPARARQLIAGGAIVGVLLGAGLLATSMYGKASAADSMDTAFKPVFAAQAVQQARTDVTTMAAMGDELAGKTLPALASVLKVTPQQLSGMMAAKYPDVAAGVAAMPAIMQRMQTSVSLIEGNVDNYAQTASIPWQPGSMVTVYWYMMVPALLLMAVGAGALLATRERTLGATVTTWRAGHLHR